MFKSQWEKTSVIHALPEGLILSMVQLAYPNTTLIFHELIPGGCANLNIKIQLESIPNVLILRIYLRDKTAALREQKLGEMLKGIVPIPSIYYVGQIENYHFAIAEFMPGITLRSLLLGKLPYDINTIMHEAGSLLSKINSHTFTTAGFLDEHLNIVPFNAEGEELIFAKNCLKNENVTTIISPDKIVAIHDCLNKFGYLLPDTRESHLVHGDFDPANILVNQINGLWSITGILDWEFAFSGSLLWDLANMLRYAHKMPLEFQKAFIKGLISTGMKLPKDWHLTIKLLNVLSLLDCLKRSDPNKSPNQCFDISELIDYMILELNAKEAS